MASKSNNELLGDILGMLDEIISDNKKRNKASKGGKPGNINVNVKGESEMVTLLSGVLALKDDKSVDILASLISALATGIKGIELIDHKSLQNSVKVLSSLFSMLGKIKLDEANMKGMIAASSAMTALATMNMKGLEQLGELDALAISRNTYRIMDALKQMGTGLNKKDIENLKPLQEYVSKFTSIVNSAVNSTVSNMNPIKAKWVGMKMKWFYKDISKQFIDLTMEISNMLKNVKLNKDSSIGFKNIMEAIGNIDMDKLMTFNKKAKKLNQQSAYNFVEFMYPILDMVNELQNGNTKKGGSKGEQFKNIMEGLTTFIGSFSVAKMLGLKMAVKVMNQKNGESIAKFFTLLAEANNKFDEKKAKLFSNVIGTITKGIGMLLLMAIGAAAAIKVFGVGGVIMGMGTLLAVTGTLVLIMKMSSKMKSVNKDAIDSIMNMTKAIGMVILAIGAVMLLEKIGGEEAILGATLFVGGITLALIGIVVGVVMIDMGLGVVSKIIGGKGGVFKQGASSLRDLGVGVFMAVAAIGVVMLILKLGTQKEIWNATMVVLGVTLALVGIILIMSHLGGSKQMEASTGALLGMGVCVMLMTLAIGAMTYIVKKNKVSDIMISLGIVAVVTLGMIGVIWALSKVSKGQLIAGSLTIVVLTLCISAIAYIINNQMIPLAANYKDALIGGGIVFLAIGLMTGIVYLLSKIDKKDLLTASLAMLVIGVVVSAVAYVANKYFIPLGKDTGDALAGGAITLGVVGIMALLIAACGKMDKKSVITGAITMAATAGLLWLISKAMNVYTEMCEKVNNHKLDILAGSVAVMAVLTALIGAVVLIGTACIPPSPLGLILAVGAGVFAGLSVVLLALSAAVSSFVDLVVKVNKELTSSAVSQFTSILTGDHGMGEAIVSVVEALNGVGLFAVAKASVIASNLKPLFETLTMFMDIVTKLATMKVVEEYDKDGKPAKWKTLNPQDFQSAGVAISNAFGTFLKQLGEGLDSMSIWSVMILEDISESMMPLMEGVSSFTDSILSVLTTKIPCEWDKDGKPIKFKGFNKEEFGEAAVKIADGFATFLTVLGPALKKMPFYAGDIINSMKDGIEPLMKAVSTYSNTILDVATGRQFETTDPKTHQLIKQRITVDPKDFEKAGHSIADSFSYFLNALSSSLKKNGLTKTYQIVKESHTFSANEMEAHSVVGDLIQGLSGIGTIMDTVNKLVDMIFKVADNPKLNQMLKVGSIIANSFTSMIIQLSVKLGSKFIKDRVTILQGIMPLLKNIFGYMVGISKTLEMVKQENLNKINDIPGMLMKLASDKNIEIYKQAKQTIDNTLLPLLRNLSAYLKFFDNGSFAWNNFRISVNLKNSLNYSKQIADMINYEAKAINAYNQVAKGQPNTEYMVRLYKTAATSYTTIGHYMDRYTNKLYTNTNRLVKPSNMFVNLIVNQTRSIDGLALAFNKLDDAILKKKDERLDALKELKTTFSEIGEELTKVNDSLDKTADYRRQVDNMRQERQNESVFRPISDMKNAVVQTVKSATGTASTAMKANGTNNRKDSEKSTGISEEQQQLMLLLGHIIAQSVTAALDQWANKNWSITFRNNQNMTLWTGNGFFAGN